jgi:RNA polymerase sigma-70 factor (ECF subfamily)
MVVWEGSKPAFEEKFRELLNAYGASISRLAASYTADASERDDLVQEIAIAIWRALPRFRSESSERTFIFRIAHNRAISHLAQRRPRSGSIEDALEPPDHRPSPEEGASKEQETARLLAAIQHLPIQYRQVITLALEDLNYTETAEILGISESNVGVRLSRARIELTTG